MPSFLTIDDVSEEDYLLLVIEAGWKTEKNFVGFGLLANSYFSKKCFEFGGSRYVAIFQTYSDFEGRRTFFCFRDKIWWQAKNFIVDHLKRDGEPFFATERGGQWCLK